MKNKVTVKVRKLGKHKAYGLFHPDTNLIEIHPDLPPLKELEIYCHEYTHFTCPDWDEKRVTDNSKKLAKFLWKQNYRKVKNK